MDDRLLAEAQALLGTRTAEETVAACLQEIIQYRRKRWPAPMTSPAQFQEFLRRATLPLGEGELSRRRAAVEAADRARVKVGPAFDVVEELRQLRDGRERQFQDGSTQ